MKLFWKFMKLVKLIKRCVALVLLTALILVLIPGSRHWLHENLVARRDGSAIKRYFNEALERGDVDAALKYAKFYEERAKKEPVAADASAAKDADEAMDAYMDFYVLALEAAGNFEKALESYEKRFAANSAGGSPSRLSARDKARILYKKGAKKEAFLAYCEDPFITSRHDGAAASRLTDKKARQKLNESLRQMQKAIISGGEEGRKSLACFENYAEFLAFLDEEFEKLGRPEEYADAVEKYHSIETKSR